MPEAQASGLATLARLYGVQTAYYGFDRRRKPALVEALLAVLRSLDAEVEGFRDIPDAIRKRLRGQAERLAPPVTVNWQGSAASAELQTRVNASGLLHCQLQLENGELNRWQADVQQLSVISSYTLEGVLYVRRRLLFPAELPPGYHQLELELGKARARTLVITAPLRTAQPLHRGWGAFLPLYAVHSGRSLGAADFSDIERMLEWLSGLGAGSFATLPLLASFLDGEPFEPSPYAPVSRLFWNEFYLDLERIAEEQNCAEANAIMASPQFQAEIGRLNAQRLVDYKGLAWLKRRVLAQLSQCFFSAPGERHREFERFLEERPLVREYARFRAAAEKQGRGWPAWPEKQRDGKLEPADYKEDAEQYHLYAQWLTDRQLGDLSAKGDKVGVALYLDLPLGVHPDGFDVWREQSLFATGVSAGAPPDGFFSGGQDWGFRPLKPEALRQQGYSYFIAALRQQMRIARVLRIDHVMQLHRLYWVPKGLAASEGVYVHYPAEELYAIVALESQRHGCVVVGEDLGTVPEYVRASMRRHGLQRLYVLPFEVNFAGSTPLIRTPPAASVASLNTHDLPPFAKYWRGLSLQDRQVMIGYLRQQELLPRSQVREEEIMLACLKLLAGSRARMLLINLEDLWLEKEQQNMPGSGPEQPNWRRKSSRSSEEMTTDPWIQRGLQEISDLRGQPAKA